MAACIVCNNQVVPDDLHNSGETAKLQSRLAQVLGEMVPVDAVMCSSCQCDLAQIEMYYVHLKIFKKRYAETAKERKQLKESQNCGTNRNIFHETIDYKPNDLQNIFGAGNSLQHSDIHPPMDSEVTNDSKIFAPFVKLEIIDVRTLQVEKASIIEHAGTEREHLPEETYSDGFEDNTWESDIDESEINTPKPKSSSAVLPDAKSRKVVKKRGRPKKTTQSAVLPILIPRKTVEKHGRPRKGDRPKAVSSTEMIASTRKRGRPKNTEQPGSISVEVSTTMKNRGRPKNSKTSGPEKDGKPKPDVLSDSVKTEVLPEYPNKHEQPGESEESSVDGQCSDESYAPSYNDETEQSISISVQVPTTGLKKRGRPKKSLTQHTEESDDPSYDYDIAGSSAEDSESDADDPDFGLEPLRKRSFPSSKTVSLGTVELVVVEGMEVEAAGPTLSDSQPTTSITRVDGGSPVKKKIGRPRKIVVDTGPKRPRGRPRKDYDNPKTSTPSQPKKYYNKPQTCKLCQKVLGSWASFKIHMAFHGDERPFKCQECGLAFKTSSCLNRHVNTHKGEKRFKCKICDKACVRIKDLEKHMSVHSDVQPYKCDQCENRSFKLPEYLKTHIRLHHIQGKQFLCSKCGYATYTEGSLRSHMMKHNDKVPREKPFKCQTCGKGFVARGSCQRHEEIHIRKMTREKHLCPICGKAVFNKYYLQQHIKQHTGESDFACSLCKKTFTSPSGLRLHMMAHRGETPLKCEICNKGFRLTTNLKTHMMMHTDERPWKCEICDLNFRRKPNLKDHLLTKKHKEAATKSGKTQSVNEAFQQLERLAEDRKKLCISQDQPIRESETLQVSVEQPTEEFKPFPTAFDQPTEVNQPVDVMMEMITPESPVAEVPISASQSFVPPMTIVEPLPLVIVPITASQPFVPPMTVAESIAPPASTSQDGIVPYVYYVPNEDAPFDLRL